MTGEPYDGTWAVPPPEKPTGYREQKGYVRQRPNGRWIARVRDRDGKQISKTFDTEKDARGWVTAQDLQRHYEPWRDPWPGFDEETGEFRRPRDEGPAQTVSEYAHRIIDGQDIRPTTKHAYEQSLRLYIDPTTLGRTGIGLVTPEEIIAWWDGVKKAGRNNALQVLSKTFKRAVLVGDLSANPLDRCPDVKRKRKRRQIDPLTVAEIEALADAAGAPRPGVSEYIRDRDRLLVLVMGYVGLRAGEVAALRPSDLVDGCRLRVHRAVNKVTGQDAYVGEPKSTAGKRTLTIECGVWDELKAFAAKYEIPIARELFVGKGDALLGHQAVNHAVSGAGQRIGLDVNSHQLRHSAVSLLIDRGANHLQIQAFVGHSDIKETLGTYGHLFNNPGDDLADIMKRMREEHRNGS